MDETEFDEFYSATSPRITRQVYALIGDLDEAQESKSVVDAVRSAAQDCEGGGIGRKDPVYQVFEDTTGQNSVTFGFTHNQGLGGTLYQFTQLGPAALVTSQSDEFDAKSMRTAAPELTRLNAPLLGMSRLFDGTC